MDPTVRRRRRPALSCWECRRRKVKCDHSNPCAHCARHGKHCVYKPFARDDSAVSPKQRSGSPGLITTSTTTATATTTTTTATSAAATIATATAIPPSIGVLPNTSSSGATARENIPGSNQTPSGFDSAIRGGRDSGLDASGPCHVLDRPRRLEEPSASQAGAGNNSLRAPAPRLPGTQDWQPLLSKQRDWGRTRWVGDATEFSSIIACYAAILGKEHPHVASYQKPEIAPLIAEASHALQACKNSAKGIKVTRPTRGLPTPFAFLGAPSPEVSRKMASLYFENFESTHRILHAPTFWADYQRYCDHPASVQEEVRHIILLVVGIGSSLYEHADAAARQHNTEVVHQWIYAAETWLSGPLEKDRLDIAGLQVHCLAMLARQIFSMGGDTVWVSTGSLLNAAMQIGMHRDPSHLPAMSLLQAELRRRLWATILELVVQSALDAWMPPRISLDEFDTRPPSNINDDEISESTTVLRPHPKETFTSTAIQIALRASFPTRLRIVQFLNSLNSDRSYQRALALTAELTSSIQTNAALFAPKKNSPKPRCTPFHRNLLDYLTRRFLIPLHFPFSHRARSNPLFHYSLKVSLNAALALAYPEKPTPQGRRRRRRQQQQQQPAGNGKGEGETEEEEEEEEDESGKAGGDEDAFSRLLTTAGGMFREGLRCAAAAVSLELLAHAEAQRRDGSLRRSAHLRGALVRAVAHLLAHAEARVARGAETNVKLHMFLSMVLAQVRALEEQEQEEQGSDHDNDDDDRRGGSVEAAIARAARDSLRFCCGLLSARAAAEGNLAAVGIEGMPGFDFDGFGEEVAWESFFSNGWFG
ncbi:hypothetical protein MYCTH_44521 [Thermothelomyces thermophilus ATCC 42464]|uniref:Zn(2)-C6 fungal-type domain-containing protein n=1 Tax=Thermothelomyces thermophilus (strain ATCC 42464 / BCRC 31852 / DSM 1799) TaxID=573729 RepID=G2Q3B3_THET4|nr:uncharacterized protein MYCTH_44521 [Thermothelomyces thermophilus ATCC 42464]AEO54374.1 hypothetical protein MYCTH_44521 [Thermothelomyces thermophilus ATCC 42464]